MKSISWKILENRLEVVDSIIDMTALTVRDEVDGVSNESSRNARLVIREDSSDSTQHLDSLQSFPVV